MEMLVKRHTYTVTKKQSVLFRQGQLGLYLFQKDIKIKSCASLGFIPLVVYSRVKRAFR